MHTSVLRSMCAALTQDKIDDKAQQRKEDQAEYDRVVEVYQERLKSLAQDAQDTALVCCAAPLVSISRSRFYSVMRTL